MNIKIDKSLFSAVHTFLLPLSFIIFLLAHNIEQVEYQVVLTPVLVVLFVVGLVFSAVKLFIKDNIKAGIVSSIILSSLFYFGLAHQSLKKLSIIDSSTEYLYLVLAAWLVCTIYFVYVFVKTKRDLANIAKIINFSVISFLVISLINIFIYEVSKPELASEYVIKPGMAINKTNVDLPDIYYFMPDEYAGLDTLRNHFGYENKEFVDFLENRGFVVPRKSRSNYSVTLTSLSSTLNLKYINEDLSNVASLSSQPAYRIPQKMIENNEAMFFLKSQGYKFITFDSGWAITDFNKNADIFYNKGYFNEFSIILIRATILKPLILGGDFVAEDMRKRILGIFDELKNIPEIKGPKFIFAHIVSPHGPYIFGPNGEKVLDMTELALNPEEEKKRYLDQLIFISKKLQDSVTEILNKSKTPPIIIIQSDHGVWLSTPEVNEDEAKGVRLKNFSAYYLPGKDKNIVPQDMSAVNTFRLIFNQYFGLNLEMLESRSYLPDDSLRKFEDITDKITFD